MIILISGPSHTGKTLLAQRLLEMCGFPYLSVDHLKMGLIRSENTWLTPEDDEALTGYLWPIVREMIKTAIENRQNLIVEGCYIPFDWKADFSESYLREIREIWLVMSREYIETHISDIWKYANAVEKRVDDTGCTQDFLLRENEYYENQCRRYGCDLIWIDQDYEEVWNQCEERIGK